MIGNVSIRVYYRMVIVLGGKGKRNDPPPSEVMKGDGSGFWGCEEKRRTQPDAVILPKQVSSYKYIHNVSLQDTATAKKAAPGGLQRRGSLQWRTEHHTPGAEPMLL